MYQSIAIVKSAHSQEAFAQLIGVNLNLYADQGWQMIWSAMPDTRTFHAIMFRPAPTMNAEPPKGAENADVDQPSAPVSDTPQA